VRRDFKIITVGFSPAWDITCRVNGLDWGGHKVISEMTCRPAGKAMNVSRALAWTGIKSVAAGLWGKNDFEQMLDAMRPLSRMVKVKETAAEGSTRQNITIVDTARNRDMHLRNKSGLATRTSVRELGRDLSDIAAKGSVCVFAGAMPEGKLLDETILVVKNCRDAGARIAVDTSGPALKKIVGLGNLWLIKPNVDELGEMLGERIDNDARRIAEAARGLLDRVKIILISRGARGAVVVCERGCCPLSFEAKLREGGAGGGRGKASSTVGCGDYLLAGFLRGMQEKGDIRFAIETAVKVAAARAWGWCEKKTWKSAESQIRVEIAKL
jgi:1-phosphofructokinase family hexose kinase